MNATRPPLPASLTRAEAEAAGDIDAQIRRIEQRLIAREENLRRGLGVFTGQLREKMQPRRLLVPVGGAVLGLVALVSLLRRPRPQMASASAPPHEAPAGTAPPRPVPWMQLFGLVWPMLPQRWQERVNPTTVSSLMVLGQPLLDSLFGRGGTQSLPTLPEVDLLRLSGRWFIVGELPGPLQAAAAEPPELGLLAREDGAFDLLQRRIDAKGTHGSEARVQPVPGGHGARLRVSHWPEPLQWLDFAWSELGVLHVDDAHEEALIGSPDRNTLWLLSRRPALDDARRQALALIGRELGFAVEKLRFY